MVRKISGQSKSPSFTHLNTKRGTKATSKEEIANTLGEAFWIIPHLGFIQRSFKTSKNNKKRSNLISPLQMIPWVLNFPPCRGPGGSIPTENVASLVSSNCPLWEERRGNTTRLPWVATRKPEEGILEVESYWEFVLS